MYKVFLASINTYPGCPLSGCVNDAIRMSQLLPKHFPVAEDNIRLLVDDRATKAAIMERLEWLVDGVKPGDHLYFHFSGHGSQVAERNDQHEVDQLSEIICPVDMAWDPDHYITDWELYDIFKVIPEGVMFNWASDSCHSGGLASIDRGIHNSPLQKPKFWAPPADVQWKINIAKKKGIKTARESKKLNVGFISGCGSGQTSADTVINGEHCGAFTYYYAEALEKLLKNPLVNVCAETVKQLKQDGYSQRPEPDGALINLPFWGEPVAANPVVPAAPVVPVIPAVPVAKPCKRHWYFPWTWGCKG